MCNCKLEVPGIGLYSGEIFQRGKTNYAFNQIFPRWNFNYGGVNLKSTFNFCVFTPLRGFQRE